MRDDKSSRGKESEGWERGERQGACMITLTVAILVPRFKMAHSSLARLVVKLFARGDIAGTTAHELVDAAWSDGWGRSCSLARKIVKAGSGGRQRSHIANDIIKAAESEGIVVSAVEPYIFKLSHGPTCEINLPHEFYPALVGDSLSTWCVQQDSAPELSKVRELVEEWKAHPDVECADEVSKIGVLGFHCDAAQYTSSMRAGGGAIAGGGFYECDLW